MAKSEKLVGQSFACGRPRPPRCTGSATCVERTNKKCEFLLSGRLEGETCGHAICGDHSEVVDGKCLCAAHVRFVKRQAAARVYESVH